MTEPLKAFRSSEWFSAAGIDGFLQRASIKAQGFTDSDFRDRPVIGICNNWSELTRCHLHFNLMAEAVKRGVWQAGGFPREFPTMSLGADLMRTPFMHRNLLSIEVEQIIRSNPLDGVVLIGSCDDTIPAMLMAVATVDIPAILLPGGPGLNGAWRGEAVGSSTDCHRYYSEYRAGRITARDWRELENQIDHSPGHCMTMGTASTMASISEALGIAPLGSAAIPAGDAARFRLAQAVGRRAVELVTEDLRPSRIMTQEALENATRLFVSIGGSTNAVVHLQALAGRLGLDLPLSSIDSISRTTPLLLNLKPSGQYLMEDLFRAGGVPAVLRELLPILRRDARGVSGRSLASSLADVHVTDRTVIGTLDQPFQPEGSIAVLHGNIAPDGAILKQSAATPDLLQHSGRAVVFNDYADFLDRMDNTDLDVKASDVLVIKNLGPKAASILEADSLGTVTLPKNLLRRGLRDMVRITDGRISGTAYGTVVVHVAPEALDKGPLAAVQTGDIIQLDTPRRQVLVRVPTRELQRRLSQWKPPDRIPLRGYRRLYLDHVLPIHLGCDFDFLRGKDPIEGRGRRSRLRFRGNGGVRKRRVTAPDRPDTRTT